MKLKILAPFQTNFYLVTEFPVLEPVQYLEFWDQVEEKKEELQTKIKGIRLSDELQEVHFMHSGKYHKSIANRYQSLESDALERPLHVIEIQLKEVSPAIRQEVLLLIQEDESAKIGKKTRDAMEYLLHETRPQLLCRVFNHGISLLEVDFRLGHYLAANAGEADQLKDRLKHLRRAGIVLGSFLAKYVSKGVIQPISDWINSSFSGISDRILDAADASISGEVGDGDVLWVTRTIIFESHHNLDEAVLEGIIQYWLENSIAEDREKAKALLAQTIANEDAHQMRWLNYLFREKSYSVNSNLIPETGPAEPFCDEWKAMVYCQYFYSAMEVIDLNLTRMLARSMSKNPDLQIDQLKSSLENYLKDANMLLIQYQDNTRYYKRAVRAKIDEIAGYWNFEEGLIKQVRHKLVLCQERFEILFQKEAANSATIREMIFMVFSITAIFGTGIALAQYGRSVAADADLAHFDVYSVNLIDYIAGLPTDAVLWFSSSISVILVALYLFYRKGQAA